MIKMISPLRCSACQFRQTCQASAGHPPRLEKHMDSLRTACRGIRHIMAGIGVFAALYAFIYLRTLITG